MGVERSRSLSRKTRLRLLGSVIALAAAVRLYLFWQYYCINSDGVRYIGEAKDFFFGRNSAALSSLDPPLYPLLVALLYSWVGDWELSGQLWSLASGVLLMLPLYGLLKDIYGERAALVGCALAAIGPYLARYSAHVRTESIYLLLFTTAVWLFYRGIQGRSLARLFYGGLVAGLAYLTRPEAVGLLVIVPVTLVLIQWNRKNYGWGWLSRGSLCVALGFFIFALPYVWYLSREAGEWMISRKAGLTLGISLKESGLLGPEEAKLVPDLESLGTVRFAARYPWVYAKKVALDFFPSVGAYFEAIHYAYVPFLLLGMVRPLRSRERKDFLLWVALFFYLVGFTLIYVKRRYALQLLPLSLGWTAIGVLFCWDALKQRWSGWPLKAAVAGLGLTLLGSTLPKTLKPISQDKAHIREAGRYLRAQGRSEELRLLVFDDRVAFYADAQPLHLAELEEQALIGILRSGKADYVVTEVSRWRKRHPSVALHPESFGLRLEKQFSAGGEPVSIFRVTAVTAAGGEGLF